MRFFILVVIAFIVSFLGLHLMKDMKLPMIILPKGAQHNTIGELPIVEMADDGDFYEIDADEYKDYKSISQRCYDAIESDCEYIHKENKGKIKEWSLSKRKYIKIKEKTKNYQDCIEKAEQVCSFGVPLCSDLHKHGFGWTCNTLGFR